jgi:malate dehydrogenase (oxaloacetate-decarboxylating)
VASTLVRSHSARWLQGGAAEVTRMASERDERERRANAPAEEALRLGPFYRGKMQTLPKCPVRGSDDLAIWYTPGVAAQSRAIHANPELVYEHTNRANHVAIVSDATRVLGLGDIGPLAGLPVMEGKALLFKLLGGVDATALCLATKDPDELVRAVEWLAPSFGGVNLEDIAQPKCFDVLARLRDSLDIPVWHDDQEGTATVVLAGLRNALELVGKRLSAVKIALIGCGAANTASYRLLVAAGVDPRGVVVCDRKGALHPKRADATELRTRFPVKWRICEETNSERVTGGIREALRGADACIAFSAPGPGVILPEWIRDMAHDAIVFACANPTPEIWPWDAREAGARIVATGRSDFPNQLNNSLAFPGMFRGALDVRAQRVTDAMTLAAADALAALARAKGLREDGMLPLATDPETAVCVAVAVGSAACAAGVARTPLAPDALERAARRAIAGAREQLDVLLREGLIAAPPPSAERAR